MPDAACAVATTAIPRASASPGSRDMSPQELDASQEAGQHAYDPGGHHRKPRAVAKEPPAGNGHGSTASAAFTAQRGH